MFLLFLMGLGTVSLNAQVRIGGNTPPSAAAVLDLNASDAANTGTGGLVLPRVNLTSNTMQLASGVTNLTGTLVYNTTNTLGKGVYNWNGNLWVLVNIPASSPPGQPGSFFLVLDTTLTMTLQPTPYSNRFYTSRVIQEDLCWYYGAGSVTAQSSLGAVFMQFFNGVAETVAVKVRCVRTFF